MVLSSKRHQRNLLQLQVNIGAVQRAFVAIFYQAHGLCDRTRVARARCSSIVHLLEYLCVSSFLLGVNNQQILRFKFATWHAFEALRVPYGQQLRNPACRLFAPCLAFLCPK
jgi:hypothetical protein